MNEDYMNLDYNMLHLIIIACINEADPTRLHLTTHDQVENSWLKPLCAQLNNVTDIAKLEANGAAIAASLKTVNPEVSLTMQASQKSSNAPQVKKPDPQVKSAQQMLSQLKYNPGPIDGILGPLTQQALAKFQKDHDLTVNGRLDPLTISTLKQLSAAPAR